MGRTVSQQMPDEERRERLLKALKAGGGDEVVVEFPHLAQAVGMDKAEELAKNLKEVNELTPSSTSKTPNLRRTGLATIDRLAAIDAIEEIMNPPQEKAAEPETAPEQAAEPEPAKTDLSSLLPKTE